MKIAIVGGGAIGGLLTAKFALNGKHEVHLLARSNYAALKEHGITLIEAETHQVYHIGNFEIHASNTNIPVCDIIFIAVRTNQLVEVASELSTIVHKNTKIILLQNGFNFEEEFSAKMGQGTLIYSGTCWIKATKLGETQFRHDFGNNIKLGRYNSTETIDYEIKELIDNIGLTADMVSDIKAVQLTKLALNIPFFLLATLTGCSVSEILSDSDLNQKREKLRNEIIQAAIMIKSSVDIAYVNEVLLSLKKMEVVPPESRALFADRMKEELPANAGSLIAYMKKRGIDMSLLQEFYCNIFK